MESDYEMPKDTRLNMKQAYPAEPRLVSYAIIFHDYVSRLAKLAYREIIPLKMGVPHEEAYFNIDTFAKDIIKQRRFPWRYSSPYVEDKQEVGSLEGRLETFGDYYVLRECLADQPIPVLWEKALNYDLKGIVPAAHENLSDFVYRGNTLLFLHRQLRKNQFEPAFNIEDEDIKLSVNYRSSLGLVRQKDLKEANGRIPYFMDLLWVAAYVKDKKDFMAPALGLTFTLPQYNGFNFIHILSNYKSREQFINVLSHEMTHAGTVYFDTKKKYLETKAYSVGKGSLILGEYAVSSNASAPLLIKLAKWLLERFFFIPVPDRYFKIVLKLRSAIEIFYNTSSYKEVENRLKSLYGKKGGYILGRLNADEIEEFRDTNDIPARIAMKNDLKWNIMKTNFAKL